MRIGDPQIGNRAGGDFDTSQNVTEECSSISVARMNQRVQSACVAGGKAMASTLLRGGRRNRAESAAIRTGRGSKAANLSGPRWTSET
jgi:hypothetical protein